MAFSSGRDDPALSEQLFARSHGFEFFQAVRLFHWMAIESARLDSSPPASRSATMSCRSRSKCGSVRGVAFVPRGLYQRDPPGRQRCRPRPGPDGHRILRPDRAARRPAAALHHDDDRTDPRQGLFAPRLLRHHPPPHAVALLPCVAEVPFRLRLRAGGRRRKRGRRPVHRRPLQHHRHGHRRTPRPHGRR